MDFTWVLKWKYLIPVRVYGAGLCYYFISPMAYVITHKGIYNNESLSNINSHTNKTQGGSLNDQSKISKRRDIHMLDISV